jgi:hypothetical protein
LATDPAKKELEEEGERTKDRRDAVEDRTTPIDDLFSNEMTMNFD